MSEGTCLPTEFESESASLAYLLWRSCRDNSRECTLMDVRQIIDDECAFDRNEVAMIFDRYFRFATGFLISPITGKVRISRNKPYSTVVPDETTLIEMMEFYQKQQERKDRMYSPIV